MSHALLVFHFETTGAESKFHSPVSSRSAIVKTEKQASSTQWFLRAGLNIMNFSGDGAEGADSNIGYNDRCYLAFSIRG